MNNEQVAHLWANKSRQAATSSHFYFDGETIYSYGTHFPIARHYKGVVLFTTQGHSVHTSRHKSIVLSACSHLLTVFEVSNPMNEPSGKDVKGYAQRIADSALALARKRIIGLLDFSQHQDLVSEANAFCERFGFKTRFSMPDDKTLAGLKERAKIATAERNAEIAAENADTVKRWIAGEMVSIPYSVPAVYLRSRAKDLNNAPLATGDKRTWVTTMKTSKGATVPLADAEKAFRFVMLKRASGWHRNGDQFQIGEFQLDAVNEQGVIAGCHRVAWAEIERFAALQGWI